MNWKDNPEIMKAREYGKQFDRDMVIVLSRNADRQWVGVSYGKDKAHCDKAGLYMNRLLDEVSEGGITIAGVRTMYETLEVIARWPYSDGDSDCVEDAMADAAKALAIAKPTQPQ